VTPDATQVLPVDDPYDLRGTLKLLQIGTYDPVLRLDGDEPASTAEWALHTPDGPVTLTLARQPGRLEARAWGPGSDWAVDHLAEITGVTDTHDFDPTEPAVLRRMWRARPGLRLPRPPHIPSMLIPLVLEQLVPWKEAARAWTGIVRVLGEPAPGPTDLRLPPTPQTLVRAGRSVLIEHGVLSRQADTLRRIAREHRRIAATRDMAHDDARALLRSVPGIGPWTTESLLMRALGCADAVPTADYHLPSVVSWFFEREPRADDDRMLELLDRHRPHRGRIIQMLLINGVHAPRRGPRMPLRARRGAWRRR
jgi:3-methyladenine DNA glycosylase/8-oxoguanine DNA glycosylase